MRVCAILLCFSSIPDRLKTKLQLLKVHISLRSDSAVLLRFSVALFCGLARHSHNQFFLSFLHFSFLKKKPFLCLVGSFFFFLLSMFILSLRQIEWSTKGKRNMNVTRVTRQPNKSVTNLISVEENFLAFRSISERQHTLQTVNKLRASARNVFSHLNQKT